MANQSNLVATHWNIYPKVFNLDNEPELSLLLFIRVPVPTNV